jgi:hypothetical protein
MVSQSILSLLNEANTKLTFAETELLRPDEDTIAFAVCHASKDAIAKLLAGMLAFDYSHKTVEGSPDIKLNQYNQLGINSLMEECIKLDNNFSSIDISQIDCHALGKHDQQNAYCLSLSKVHDCAVIGRQIEKLVYNFIGSKKYVTKE